MEPCASPPRATTHPPAAPSRPRASSPTSPSSPPRSSGSRSPKGGTRRICAAPSRTPTRRAPPSRAAAAMRPPPTCRRAPRRSSRRTLRASIPTCSAPPPTISWHARSTCCAASPCSTPRPRTDRIERRGWPPSRRARIRPATARDRRKAPRRRAVSGRRGARSRQVSDSPEAARAQGYRPGVGVMLLDAQNGVWVGRRIDMAGDNWQMPQGGIDRGESPRAAALRELKEEIGTDKAEFLAESAQWLRYDVPQSIARRVWNERYRGQMQKWFAMRFTGEDSDIDLATGHPEFNAWKWVSPAELPRLIVPFKRQLYRDILAEFGKLCGLP